jgi:hypothetical protein
MDAGPGGSPPPDDPQLVEIYFTDFNVGGTTRMLSGVSAGPGGPYAIVGVQGFASHGFSGQFSRNNWPSPMASTFTFQNLPAHSHVHVSALLAIIDSWDGTDSATPDSLEVRVDGQLVFSRIFCNYGDDPFDFMTYVPPPGGVLVHKEELGFRTETNGYYRDSGYNMGVEPALQNIPHTASTLTLSVMATGADWQGGNDESFAIDDLQVRVTVTE